MKIFHKFLYKITLLKIILMNKITVILALTVAFTVNAMAQYDIQVTDKIACTSVKNQQRTGTCWSFSTISFLESELMRMQKKAYDLSEMHIVRTIYKDKARNYVLRQGKANFSQGSLAHDVIRAFAMGGVVPESVYDGIAEEGSGHNHSDMEAALKGMLDGIIKQKRPNSKWQQGMDALMDVYMGAVPAEFEVEGKSYNAKSYAESLGIRVDDYITFTSYTHHPFYDECILEIPDNYSNGSYYNVPLEDLEAIAANALTNGYTISWDGDVSEKGFSSRDGLAILPVDSKRIDLFANPGEEIAVTQDLRQSTFMNYSTTDDHLMHITGMAKDKNGTKYYLVKNSWGPISDLQGFLYMSEAYFNLKTVGIMVHKDAVPTNIRKKLGGLGM